jgi:hypothetical protein
MCAMAQSLPEHQGSAELPRIPIPRNPVNRVRRGAGCYYAPKANKFTRNTALRKRKPRRSGAFLVKGDIPSCKDCWAR